jgi:protein-arginine kinase activator protein McsA
MDRSLRRTHHIEATLQEQLKEAVAKEEYERAARIRDEMKSKPH